MWSHIGEDSDHVRYILELSFNDLPHHLKLCFLYLGLFPEDYGINAEGLCWLWEAEGFINSNEEPFEMAFLQQLIDRSLILVTKRNWRRIVKCRVHDLIRDLAIQKSKELNFLDIYDGTDHSLLTPSSRRLALHNGFHRFVSSVHSKMRFRTLLSFDLFESEKTELQHLCKMLRLLRVLDFGGLRDNTPVLAGETMLHDQIGKLIHLRYFGLSPRNRHRLPPSIGKLHALQTVDLSYYDNPIQLPDEIRNAKQLRRLIGAFKWPFPVDKLTKLQTLRYVKADGPMEIDLTGMINLRELGVLFWLREGPFTLDSVDGLRSLQALAVEIGSQVSLPALQPLSRCRNLFQIKLIAKSAIKVPAEVHQFLPNLKYLLIRAPLTEDPMPVLEKLPTLTILVMRTSHVYKLACSAGGFPLLEILKVSGFGSEKMEVEGGAMPMLKGFQALGFVVHENSQWLHSIPPPPSLDDNVWPYSFSN